MKNTTAKRKIKKIRIDDYLSGVNNVLDESVIKENKFPIMYNFDFSKGILTDGYGIALYEKLKNYDISSFWIFKRGEENIFMFSLTNGEIYYINNEQVTRLFDITLSGTINAINYRLYGEDVILIYSDNHNMLVWNGNNHPYFVLNSPFVKSMALFDNRMFVADKSGQLKYSDDLDATNWNNTISEGGVVETYDQLGAINKVIPFLSYLYVFRDYGIARVNSTNQYSINNLFVISGKIYSKTVTLCGNRIIFLADDGLYSFDGASTKKLLPQIEGCIEANENATAMYHNGKYYIALRLNIDDNVIGCENQEYTNNGLIIYDLNSGNYCINRGMDITCLIENNLGISNNKVVEIIKKSRNLNQVLLKRIASPFNQLDSHLEKVLREIYITTNKDIDLTVYTDSNKREFLVKASELQSKIRVNLKGVNFSFSIKTQSDDIRILPLTIIMEE